jgi:glucose-6-phosphate dehydrogenase assembly protein OpcA
VTWWPGRPPGAPSESPLGTLAQRRVTDTASEEQAQHVLGTLARSYKPGDTDFSWSRLTPWRTLLAATFDVPHPPVLRAEVLAEAGNPSGDILTAWLSVRLGIPVHRGVSSGPGITDVSFETERGRIGISRSDGRTATLSRTGEPDRRVALHRRDQSELLAEELRRLDPDDVYAESLEWLFGDHRQEGDDGAFTLDRPSTARQEANRAAEKAATGYPVDEPAAGHEPSLRDADAAATESMDADEGETGVEAEQEIQES